MVDIDFAIKGKYLLHIRKFFLLPEFWVDANNNIENVDKSNWKSVKFTKSNKGKLPSKKGVYAFVVKPKYPSLFETNYLFYIGKTTRTLQKRFGEYFDERDTKGKYRIKVREMLKLYDGHIHFYYLPLITDKQVSDAEDKLLNTFVPHINTQIPKATVKPELKSIYEGA